MDIRPVCTGKIKKIRSEPSHKLLPGTADFRACADIKSSQGDCHVPLIAELTIERSIKNLRLTPSEAQESPELKLLLW